MNKPDLVNRLLYWALKSSILEKIPKKYIKAYINSSKLQKAYWLIL